MVFASFGFEDVSFPCSWLCFPSGVWLGMVIMFLCCALIPRMGFWLMHSSTLRFLCVWAFMCLRPYAPPATSIFSVPCSCTPPVLLCVHCLVPSRAILWCSPLCSAPCLKRSSLTHPHRALLLYVCAYVCSSPTYGASTPGLCPLRGVCVQAAC